MPLTLPACEALAKMGYPQKHWPQFVRYIYDDRDGCYCEIESDLEWPDWVAQPSEVEALDWLEKELGYRWERWAEPGIDRPTWWAKHKDAESHAHSITTKTPSDLILAIGEHRLAQQTHA